MSRLVAGVGNHKETGSENVCLHRGTSALDCQAWRWTQTEKLTAGCGYKQTHHAKGLRPYLVSCRSLQGHEMRHGMPQDCDEEAG